MKNKISELKSLVYQVDGVIQVMLLKWIEDNIVEFGISDHISNEEIIYNTLNIEKLREYRKRTVASKVGLEMLDKLALKEVRDTPYSEETTYRIFAIKG